MGIPRYKAKRDASEKSIVDALRSMGFSVELMDQPCDALAGFRGVNYLLEFKTGSKGYGKKLNDNQQKFDDNWRGMKLVKLSSEDEAISWAQSVAAGDEWISLGDAAASVIAGVRDKIGKTEY